MSWLTQALESPAPAIAGGDQANLYAFLVGQWDIQVVLRDGAGSHPGPRGTISANWVLQGRAIQDVFAVPGMFYGTSLRFFDPHLDAWQVFWIDPMKQVFFRMIARQENGSIINEGRETPELARAYGLSPNPNASAQWIFSDIQHDSFHWRSQRSEDGKQWTVQREYLAKRVNDRGG